MPELPEVEVLVRALAPQIVGRVIDGVRVRQPKIVAPASVARFTRALVGARIQALSRRGKYLRFDLRAAGRDFPLLGHLGMTGRMYLQPLEQALPKHAVVVLRVGREAFVFEDYRRFGRLTLATQALDGLGPEPLGRDFSLSSFTRALAGSSQAVKVRLLDQSVVAGVGNIYASEALFLARIPPRRPSRQLTPAQIARLRRAVREVLRRSIARGSTVLTDAGPLPPGVTRGPGGYHAVRLRVYDRAGLPCLRCRAPIRRITQAGRSTFFCPACQRG